MQYNLQTQGNTQNHATIPARYASIYVESVWDIAYSHEYANI